MLSDNAYYGHSSILAKECGLASPPPIWGYLQHGLSIYDPFADYRLERRLPKLVWGEPSARLCRDAGRENVVALGAPMAYLWRASSTIEERAHQPLAHGRTIVYPYHSWERNELEAPHATFAAEIAEREAGDVTVCLYWREARHPEIVDAYASQGFRVICHGDRYNREFLQLQHVELRRHDRYVTNQIGTSVFYAALHGLAVDIYGPRFLAQDPAASDERVWVDQRQRWPDLFESTLDQDAVRSLASAELGVAGLRSPDELIDILGWGRVRRSLAPVVRSSIAIRRRAKGLEPLPASDVPAGELVPGWDAPER